MNDDTKEKTEGKGPIVAHQHVPKWININIKFVDGHYLATFQHDEVRIFHNMQELLSAIEVEAGKLDPGRQY